jgi:hypothetical protein
MFNYLGYKSNLLNLLLQLNVAVNEAKYTYDGIDICGKRLFEKVSRITMHRRLTLADNDDF